MTRRITIAILLTVWCILVATGLAVYLTIRTMLVRHLDLALLGRALTANNELVDEDGEQFVIGDNLLPDDRFVGKSPANQTVLRRNRAGPRARGNHPEILAGQFFRTPEGRLMRNIRFQAFVHEPDGSGLVPMEMAFSGGADEFDAVTSRLGWAVVACAGIGGLIVALTARRVARVALRPLEHTAEAIGAIDERKLDRRIDVSRLPGELIGMAGRLNEMLERLDHAFARRKRFLAGAAHELRTPVAAFTTALEVALRRPRGADEYRQTLETCLADARVLRSLVESLLGQARADLPDLDEPVEVIELVGLIRQCVQLLDGRAQEHGVTLRYELTPERSGSHRDVSGEQGPGASDVAGGWTAAEPRLYVTCQPGRVRAVFINLIGNAIEHNRSAGTVTVRLAPRASGGVTAEIEDSGQGIEARHLPHLFEPFYRVDGARRSDGHMGLGLFLVKSHIDALHWECRVRSQIGRGTVFEVVVPASFITGPRPSDSAPAREAQSSWESPAARETRPVS